MGIEEKLKVAQAVLRDIADMDERELAAHGRRRALKGLAFSDAPLSSVYDRDHGQEARSIAHLIERIEHTLQDAAAKAMDDRYPMTWVKLDRYIDISGDTVDAVQSRRKAGKWLDGNQCKLVDGRLWINLKAVDEWIARWGK
ncbi:hypothetical protein ACEN9F_30690 [Duganella sp. CT11-25]|uniref:hypothetical protein n=1 Tax=unclassified Duganella TaxID=2636909 RepID=UPI0039AF4421